MDKGVGMRPSYDEINKFLHKYLNSNLDAESLQELLLNYIDDSIDAAVEEALQKRVDNKRPELPEAIGIEVYDLLIEGYSNGHGIHKQIAYHIARGLLLNYDLYLKERK